MGENYPGDSTHSPPNKNIIYKNKNYKQTNQEQIFFSSPFTLSQHQILKQ